MGGYPPKIAASRLGVTHKDSRLGLGDASNREDRDVQSCNRLGCSTRLNCMKSSHPGISDRAKYSKPPFSSGKSVRENSSKTYSSVFNSKKHRKEPQDQSSHKQTVTSETSNIQVQTQVSDSILPAARIQVELSEADDVNSEVLKDASVNIPEDVEGYRVTSKTKTRTRFHERSGLGNQNALFGSPKLSSASSKVTQSANSASRGGLRKLGCTSITDVLSSGSSSSHLSHNGRAEVMKKRSDGECSSSGKIMSGPSIGRSPSTRGSLSRPRPPLSEPPAPQQTSKRTRKQTLSRDDGASVSGQATSGDNRAMTRRHGKGNRSAQPKPLRLISQLSQSELSTPVSPPPTTSQLSPTKCQNSCSTPGGIDESVPNQLTGHREDGTARPPHALSVDEDELRHLNADEIAEVLSALERIEQDELTYEQRLVLESNLFLDGLSFLDQHRDMRLDIDNMSYEELLDLEEKMGTVSMALTEAALSNCLGRSLHNPACLDARSKKSADDDDVKCSICQDEYVEGDEVGKLGCDHGYHMMCIHQWLRQKNWCPICKAPAEPS